MNVDPRAEEWAALGRRLVSLSRSGHPVGAAHGERFASALLEGRPPHQALADAGVAPAVAGFVERAATPELSLALDGLATALGRAERRARALAGMAWYAWLVAAAAALALGVVQFAVVPAMEELARGGKDALAPVDAGQAGAVSLAALCILALFALGFVLRNRRPLAPFAGARLQQERALVLGAAVAAVRGGADLSVALRAAAGLSADAGLRGATLALAASLEAGEAKGGKLLLGELGAGLFAGAAGQGVGAPTLFALAEYEEAAAEGEWSTVLMKAELWTMGLGGLAVVGAGAALMLIYSGGLLL